MAQGSSRGRLLRVTLQRLASEQGLCGLSKLRPRAPVPRVQQTTQFTRSASQDGAHPSDHRLHGERAFQPGETQPADTQPGKNRIHADRHPGILLGTGGPSVLPCLSSEIAPKGRHGPLSFEEAPLLTTMATPRRLADLSLDLLQSHASVFSQYGLQVRWSGCQVRLGAPPPPKVFVEYPENDRQSTDVFISLANDIEEEFPDVVVESNPDEANPRPGSFEVTYGQTIIFSRLEDKVREQFRCWAADFHLYHLVATDQDMKPGFPFNSQAEQTGSQMQLRLSKH